MMGIDGNYRFFLGCILTATFLEIHPWGDGPNDLKILKLANPNQLTRTWLCPKINVVSKHV